MLSDLIALKLIKVVKEWIKNQYINQDMSLMNIILWCTYKEDDDEDDDEDDEEEEKPSKKSPAKKPVKKSSRR